MSVTTMSYLSAVPLLSKLTDEERARLSAALTEQTFPNGARIVGEGDDGDAFYIIKNGFARVSKRGVDGADSELCVLKSADYFGEQALVNNSKRMATITAHNGDTTCLTLNRERFHQLFNSDRLNITFVKRAAVSAETYDPTVKTSASSIPDEALVKTPAQKSMLINVANNSLLFASLNGEQRSAVVDQMYIKSVAANTAVITQGDIGQHFFVVESGRFDIFVKKPNDAPTTFGVKVAQRESGESFGELALLYNAPRAATVVATTPSQVWTLERSTFRKLLTSATDSKLSEYESFLLRVKSFEGLLDYERARIAEALEVVTFPPEHVIVRQGEQGDTFFIIKQGSVRVTMSDRGVDRQVAQYSVGDYFGERALVNNEVRAATVSAIDSVVCLYLNREAFSLLLGPMEDIFKRRQSDYDAALKKAPQPAAAPQSQGTGPASATVAPVDYRVKDILFNDLLVIGTLGKGSFGHVRLVKHRVSGQTYALKTVNKFQIVQLGQQEHMINEKNCMAALNHPFLIRLMCTYKDADNLYLLLEVSLGGELFTVLRSRQMFDESTARFYAAGVVLAFEYMHERGYIYRDLKPENLLLDNGGYLKITDFGFAKLVGDHRTWTLCGTPDYLAPEVVSGSGHGKAVDWWTLGILLYEMLASYPPFYDEDPMRTYAKIMASHVHFPSHFSRPAIDLIHRLLHPKATKRLGAIAGGAKLIKEHLFFKGFDWAAFYNKQMRAPIIQNVRNPEDLSNFEKYPAESGKGPKYQGDPKHPDWDKNF